MLYFNTNVGATQTYVMRSGKLEEPGSGRATANTNLNIQTLEYSNIRNFTIITGK